MPKAVGMGRPPKEISIEEFEKLCVIHCTKEEIAGWFDCSDDTIERFCHDTYGETFAATFKKKSSGGKISLRRTQYQAAIKGNTTMLVWLGKQLLGQKNEVAVTERKDEAPQETEAKEKLDRLKAMILDGLHDK